MKNKIITLILSTILLLSLSACNSDSGAFLSGQNKDSDFQEKQEDLQSDKDKEDKENKEDAEKEEIKKDKSTNEMISLYYSDNQAMNLIETKSEVIVLEGESLEKNIIEALKVQPKDAEMFNAVEENIKINKVEVEGSTALVDISSEDLQGSSTQEIFLIDSIVASLTSLEHIESVKFLIDGKEADTLMGHMEIVGIFTIDDVETNIIKAK